MSVRVTLVTASIPLLVITEVYRSVSPTATSAKPALLTTATFGSLTGIDNVLDEADPAIIRPSGT
ncbi:hypothetical protein D3C71_2094460 [compost metagenome]